MIATIKSHPVLVRKYSTATSVWWLGLLILTLCLAVGLRFYRLDYQSLWNDEGNSLRLAQRSLCDLIQASRLDIHPPGYYVLLKLWYHLTGDSAYALRALSALVSVLTIACTYALGTALFSQRVGWGAALLTTLNSFSLYYGQEARMYALLALWASAAMWALVRWMAAPTWRRAIPLALLNAAGLYTQYMYPFVIVIQGVLFFILHHRLTTAKAQWRQFLILNLITVALFVPQLPDAVRQVTQWPRTGQPVAWQEGLATVLRWLTYGLAAQDVAWWQYGLVLVFVVVGLLPDWESHLLPSWWRRAVPIVWLLIAIVPLFILNLFRPANLKFLLPAQLAMALLIARGGWWLWSVGSANLRLWREAWPRWLAIIGVLYAGAPLVQALTSFYDSPVFARPDYRSIATAIMSDPRLTDAIILDAPNQQEVFSYYYRGTAPVYPLPRGLGGDDAATLAEMRNILSQHQRLFVVFWGETERDPNRVVEKTLAQDAYEVASRWYGDVRLVQYTVLSRTSTPLTLAPTRFGEHITLTKASVNATTLRAGDVLGVTLTWTTSQPLTQRYKVFVHVLDRQGGLVAQHDSEPSNYLAPTTSWQVGQPITDSHGILLPLNLVSGQYQVVVGIYDSSAPAQRLNVANRDIFNLTNITVEP